MNSRSRSRVHIFTVSSLLSSALMLSSILSSVAAVAMGSNVEVLPRGINPNKYESYSRDHASFPGYYVSSGRHYQNTFQVTPKHTVLDNGVRFNVESVPDPLVEDMSKPRISRQEALNKIRERLVTAHNDQGFGNQVSSARLEAVSNHDPNLIYQGGNGFIVAVVTAFAQHLPLQLSPDTIWALIAYAFAKHVDKHPEELRHHFVTQEGKKRILIDTPPMFKMSHEDQPDTGATPVEWEEHVFSQFSTQIQRFIGPKTHSALSSSFSTTTASSKAASEIVLMATMKHYFSFGMRTMCGIPSITLLGTEQDWVALAQRAEALGEMMTPEFRAYWMPALLPVLHKFLDSYRGNVDHGFWQSMVKLRHTGGGSGAHDFISGWVQTFFPDLAKKSNMSRTEMRQWNEMYFSGPEAGEFPMVESFAPVDWEYFGKKFDLEFHAGISGVAQDPLTGGLAPVTGWFVSHTLPKPNADKIDEIEKEIQDLRLGHKDDFELGYSVYHKMPWYKRMGALLNELQVLRFGRREW